MSQSVEPLFEDPEEQFWHELNGAVSRAHVAGVSAQVISDRLDQLARSAHAEAYVHSAEFAEQGPAGYRRP